MQLNFPQPPRLPDSPPVPTGTYVAGLLNSLRLFFNQLSNVFVNVLGPNGGRYIDCPNGLFFDLDTYTPAAINTGYPLQFKVAYLNNAVHVVDDTKITVDIGGIYNFQYSGAVFSSSASAKNVYVWIVRNGTPIGYTTNQYTITGASAHAIVGWNFNIDLQVGDYIELYWSADSLNVQFKTTAPATPHTGIPTNVVAVNFIAPLPAVLPTPP